MKLTIENKPVMDGMFTYYGTHGIPLENILYWLKTNDAVMDWVDYIKDAIKDGHNPRTIASKIDAAVSEIYGRVYADEVNKRVGRVLAL